MPSALPEGVSATVMDVYNKTLQMKQDKARFFQMLCHEFGSQGPPPNSTISSVSDLHLVMHHGAMLLQGACILSWRAWCAADEVFTAIQSWQKARGKPKSGKNVTLLQH